MSKSFAPPGYNSVSPYLTVRDASALIDFLVTVFDGEVKERMTRPDGSTGHAEVRIGDSLIMMGGASPNCEVHPASLYVYVADVDATYQKALAVGATSATIPADMFYGDRVASVKDDSGNQWWIATNKEQLSHEELQRRSNAVKR
ncbi:MAG TPA: VOC family protein [Schlesneria sp.]